MNRKIISIAVTIIVVGFLIYLSGPAEQPPPADTRTSEKIIPPTAADEEDVHQQAAETPPSVAQVDTPPEHAVVTSQAPQLEPEIREALGEMLNTSSEGLVEETRNGVTSVDLQRRFQTVPVATIDENGEVHISDYTSLPREAPKQ